MRNRRNVLDHGDLETHSLQGADGRFTTLTGTLDKDLDGLETMLHSGGGPKKTIANKKK